ncbi:MAG: N-acetylmuramoyl-L-alanine amidase [Spirochaetes bacterium]|nr:N-acetylmuramoyl-L-alanine amidase [Spirochaetota bacterium]
MKYPQHIAKCMVRCVIILLGSAIILLYVPGYSDNSITLPVKHISSYAYISEYDIRTLLPVQSSFDVILQRGKLMRGPRFTIYTVGMSVALAGDLLLRSDYPVTRVQGEVMIPLDIALPMIQSLMQSHVVSVLGNTIVIEKVAGVEEKQKETTPMPVTKDAIGFIVIDAGHGGKDPGAIGKGGIKEKVLTLQIAREVALQLQKKLPGIEVMMTRTTDKFLELGQRTEIANRLLKKGVNGIFISVHCNAAVVSKISGFETYFLSQNPSNEEARTTAVLENNVIVFESPEKRKRYSDVDFIEALMLTTQIQKESSMLAFAIQKGLDRNITEFKSKGVKKADFFVLRGCLMPSALVEVGYITNPKEKSYLTNKNYQKKLAYGITEGIVNFIDAYNTTILNK